MDELTQSIRGRCGEIAERVDGLIRAVEVEDDAATLTVSLAEQVEHAAAVDAAGRGPFTFHARARAHAVELLPEDDDLLAGTDPGDSGGPDDLLG